jgi:hypothetical protein
MGQIIDQWHYEIEYHNGNRVCQFDYSLLITAGHRALSDILEHRLSRIRCYTIRI